MCIIVGKAPFTSKRDHGICRIYNQRTSVVPLYIFEVHSTHPTLTMFLVVHCTAILPLSARFLCPRIRRPVCSPQIGENKAETAHRQQLHASTRRLFEMDSFVVRCGCS